MNHGIRMNAQGSSFTEPEEILSFFRKITSPKRKEEALRYAPIRETATMAPQRKPQHDVSRSSSYKCFNCGETGHAWMRCPKDLIKCGKCRQVGHTAAQCQSKKIPITSNSTKNVLKIQADRKVSEKYFKKVTLNDTVAKAFIDFGSECSLVSDTSVIKMGNSTDWTTEDLPLLKGFGSNGTRPIARISISVAVDAVKENIELFVVPHSLLPFGTDVLLGQNLTELPNVRVLKTNNDLMLFSKLSEATVKVFIQENTPINGVVAAQVTSDLGSNYVYISSAACLKPGSEYLIMPGIYEFIDGYSEVIVMGLSQMKHTIPRGKLIARGRVIPDTMFGEIPHSIEPRPETLNVCRIVEQDALDQEEIFINDINIGENLDEKSNSDLHELLQTNRASFALSTAELGKTTAAEMHIRLKDDAPVTYRPYRLSFTERAKVKEILEDLLKNGIVRESESEYASPIIIVPKKNGELRLCVDYRALNKKTSKDKYPMPLIDDQIDSLSGQRYFTTLDLASGYHQIPIAENCKHMTAFITPDGHFEYNRMPFGLCNAPAVFQRMIHKVLNSKKISGVLTYMDDIIIASKTVEEGMQRLECVIEALKEANLTLNLRKCNFFKKEIEFLGYEISNEGIKPGQKKIEAVASFRKPSNAHEIRQFIWSCKFFSTVCPRFCYYPKTIDKINKSKHGICLGNRTRTSIH